MKTLAMERSQRLKTRKNDSKNSLLRRFDSSGRGVTLDQLMRWSDDTLEDSTYVHFKIALKCATIYCSCQQLRTFFLSAELARHGRQRKSSFRKSKERTDVKVASSCQRVNIRVFFFQFISHSLCS